MPEPVSAVITSVHLNVTCPGGTVFAAFLAPDAGTHDHPCEGCRTVYGLTVTTSPGQSAGSVRAEFTARTYEEGDGG